MIDYNYFTYKITIQQDIVNSLCLVTFRTLSCVRTNPKNQYLILKNFMEYFGELTHQNYTTNLDNKQQSYKYCQFKVTKSQLRHFFSQDSKYSRLSYETTMELKSIFGKAVSKSITI